MTEPVYGGRIDLPCPDCEVTHPWKDHGPLPPPNKSLVGATFRDRPRPQSTRIGYDPGPLVTGGRGEVDWGDSTLNHHRSDTRGPCLACQGRLDAARVHFRGDAEDYFIVMAREAGYAEGWDDARAELDRWWNRLDMAMVRVGRVFAVLTVLWLLWVVTRPLLEAAL